MKLYVVPTNQVQRFWYLAEPLLQKALEKGNGEFTAGQLKLLVTQGQQQLLLAMEQDICHGAATVQWTNYPNDRVAYITYLGGKNIKDIAIMIPIVIVTVCCRPHGILLFLPILVLPIMLT